MELPINLLELIELEKFSFRENKYESRRKLDRSSLRRLEWDLFAGHKVFAIGTSADGNCFLHSILQGFCQTYDEEKILKKREFVKVLRQELAKKLGEKSRERPSLTYYEILSEGNFESFSIGAPEFTLEGMQKILLSKEYLGYGFLEFLSNMFDKDIYVLSYSEKKLYITDEYRYSIKGNRDSLIILFRGDHFETVGILNGDYINTTFRSDHKIIRRLREQI